MSAARKGREAEPPPTHTQALAPVSSPHARARGEERRAGAAGGALLGRDRLPLVARLPLLSTNRRQTFFLTNLRGIASLQQPLGTMSEDQKPNVGGDAADGDNKSETITIRVRDQVRDRLRKGRGRRGVGAGAEPLLLFM